MPSFFSVIIACYNNSDTISRTLESLYKQTFTDFDVIIVDDNSSDYDATLKVLNFYINKGLDIKIFKHVKNKNGACARNTGIKASEGKYIAFLDADDEWLEDKLEIYHNKVKFYKNDVFVYSPVLFRTVEGDSIRPKRGIGNKEHVSEYLFGASGFIQTSTICLPQDVAKSLLFDERFRRHQDYDITLRAFSLNIEFIYIPVPLTIYNVSGAVYKAKNEDCNYCNWWLNEMKDYMTKQGYNSYRLYALSARMLIAKHYTQLLKNMIISSIALGPVGIWKTREKAKEILIQIMKQKK